MKPVPQDVPKDIKKIFDDIRELVKDHIANSEISQPIDFEKHNISTYEDSKKLYIKKNSAFRSSREYIAQFWLAIVFFVFAELDALYNKGDTESLLRPVLYLALLMALIVFYQAVIGQLPLQNTVDKLILTSKEYKDKQQGIAYYKARKEANWQGPRSPWTLLPCFSNERLQKIFDDHKIHVMIHESILLGLSAIKYQSFDCIACSALMLLKLIELHQDYTLKWYYKPGNHVDGQNFIIAYDKNDNGFLVDPFFGVAEPIEKFEGNSELLLEYPLLSLEDKELLCTVEPKYYKQYKEYIKMLNEELTSLSLKDCRV